MGVPLYESNDDTGRRKLQYEVGKSDYCNDFAQRRLMGRGKRHHVNSTYLCG